MAGKPGRSGPPANLNATKHPWRVFWRRRVVRETDRWVPALLDDYAAGLASDKPDMTESEQRLVEIALTARGCTALILAECQRSGFIRTVNGSWDLAPGARELVKFLTAERSALQAVGLERRAKPVQSLSDYLEGRCAVQGATLAADNSGRNPGDDRAPQHDSEARTGEVAETENGE